jgi:diguanylate cyclase (GGDEF)-like protein
MGGVVAVDDRLQARRRKILRGAGLNVMAHGAAIAYCAMTWSGPNRPLMLAGYGCGVAVGAFGFWATKRDRVKALGYGFSIGMLLISIAIVALGAHLDGGAGSPVALGFMIPVLFVASSTTRLSLMVALEALVIGGYLIIAATGEPAPPGYSFLYVTTMVGVMGVCATQARMVARQRSQLRTLAELDPLTGALNRRGLTEYAKHLFAHDGGAGPSVVCLDLDGFKLVNDTLGHAGGDELLQWAVTATRGVLRSADVIARTGGDEFVVILVDADATTAETVAGRIGQAVRERTGVSIGWACAPQDGDTLADLVQAADRRLYGEKNERRRVSGR